MMYIWAISKEFGKGVFMSKINHSFVEFKGPVVGISLKKHQGVGGYNTPISSLSPPPGHAWETSSFKVFAVQNSLPTAR